MTMPQSLSDKLDAAWGDPEAWVLNGLQWTHLDEVKQMINRRVSGDPHIEPLAWFASRLEAAGALPLGRILVLGCGSGRTERHLYQAGWAREIVAFDLSPKALAAARELAADMPSIRYVLADMDDLPVGEAPFEAGSFDAVIGTASVHHCAQLDKLYDAVARLLTPQGWFFLDEYVGPDRFQYSPSHIEQLSALADLLPDRLLTTASGAVRRDFRAPSVEEVMAVDPSEAACSSRIIPMLHERFAVIEQRAYGGSILQLLLADVAQNFQQPGSEPWLRALLAAEDELERAGRIEQHFSCLIARPLHSPAVPATRLRSSRAKISGS
jgi:SAM-dependent methyltransferase